jgi:hypothetical protein
MDLYHTDQVLNWGIPVREGSPAEEALRTMLHPLESIEIDEFLTLETNQWCDEQLASLGFDGILRTEEDHKRPHFQIYLALQERIQQHIDSGNEPQLQVVPIPTGGQIRYVSTLFLYLRTKTN